MLKQNSRPVERWLNDLPMLVVECGKPLRERMKHAEVSEEEVLEAARDKQGLERMDQVKYAVVERKGDISVVPVKP